MASYPELIVKRQKGVAIVLLNRPDQRNAFTTQMKDSIINCFRDLDGDSSVRVIVLTGAPNAGNAFCAGADLSNGNFSNASGKSAGSSGVRVTAARQHRDGGGQATLAIARTRKPVICAINGHSVGIGATLTLPCDIRIAWKDAKVGFVFAQRGIVPEACSSYLLPKLIGHSRAMELFMTARVQPASAPSLDLLYSSLQPTPEATVEAAIRLAHEIATKNSALSSALIKGLVWHGRESMEEQHLLDSAAMHVAGNSSDSVEGVASFLEKRAAVFTASVPKDLDQISEMYPWWADKDVRVSKL